MKYTLDELLGMQVAFSTLDALGQKAGGILEGLTGKVAAQVARLKVQVAKAVEAQGYEEGMKALRVQHDIKEGMSLADVPAGYWKDVNDLAQQEVEVSLLELQAGAFDNVVGLPPKFFELLSKLLKEEEEV